MLDLLVQQGSHVSTPLFYRVLQRCVSEKDVVHGRRVDALILQVGYESDAFLANHTICMYASHGMLEEATQVFRRVAVPDTYMWSSIILAHARHGRARQAIEFYKQMRDSTVKPDNHTFVAILKACAGAGDLAFGKQVHADLLSGSTVPDMFVRSSLVDMYAKCGSLEDARRVFDSMPTKSVVTWTSMIAGYAQHGLGEEALTLHASMQQEGIAVADDVTLSCLLKACASAGALQQGKQFHKKIQEKGYEANVVLGSCLVDMYAKCGSLPDAREVFDKLPARNVVTWNTLIAGYTENERGHEALSLHAQMQQEGIIVSDNVTLVCLLKACGSVGALHHGRLLHEEIKERQLEGDVVIGSCLVDMYAKCGRLKDARKVVDELATRNVVTWTALLNGYAQHSDARMAIQCFEEMQKQGVKPDSATFICLLVACSHAGLVNAGQGYFKMMVEDFGIAPNVAHYNCMVDLLGRAGQLDEAENILQTMPFENDTVGWTSLLTACNSYGDAERGRRCFDCLTTMEPENATPYVLLASTYAAAGLWRDAEEIESRRKFAGAKKRSAKACIEVKNIVHEFTVGEEKLGVSSKWRNMSSRLKDGGHIPRTDLVLKTLPESGKEDSLCGHAEKLALAYGLLHTPEGAPLLVTKNLRMCNDCHSATKVLSVVEKREIVVRDARCVHRFADGSCSCGDRH